MNPDEARQYILDHISVTRQQVTLAKATMLRNFDPDTLRLLDRFMASVEAQMPEKIVLHRSIDPVPTLRAAAEAISYKLAACEAIWGLIANGAVFPASMSFCAEFGTMPWTTVIPGSGGHSGGFPLDELSLRVPSRLALPRSSDAASYQPLTDPDLYLQELDLPGLHSVIETALREAVRCFKFELYLACLAMLGRASEAAWIEAGFALAKATPTDSPSKSEKFIEHLEDPFLGIGKKIQEVTKFYSRQDIFGDICKESGVRLQDLKNCTVWADCVRESRNSIHYGAEPAMSNSYEKVAALLIGAVPHIRLLSALTNAAKEQSNV